MRQEVKEQNKKSKIIKQSDDKWNGGIHTNVTSKLTTQQNSSHFH